MRLTRRVVVAFLPCVLGVIGSAGCEDADARQRDAAQKTISDARHELQKVSAGGIVTLDEEAARLQEQKLNSIVTSLGALREGDPGQQAAKALLSAAALRELAAIKLARADQIQTAHRDGRTILHGQIDAILTLEALAAGWASGQDNPQRETLQRELESAKARAAELSQKIAQLDSPIAEQASQNQANAREVEKLRLEVGQLLRQAQEQGHVQGLETYIQAAAVDRRADKLEYDIAQREIELDYSLNPEHKLASTQLVQLQSLIAAIEAAQAGLDAFAKASTDDAEATRAKMDELSSRIAQTLEQLREESSAELKPVHDDALAALEKAAGQAQSARGDEMAAVTGASIQESLGRLHWSAARALADHQAVLERLASAGQSAGRFSKFTDELGAVQAAHSQALEQAKTAYASAQELLAQASTRGDQTKLEIWKQNLDAVVAALEGRPPSTDLTTDGADLAGAPVGASHPGFDTPEALIDYVQSSLTSDQTRFEQMLSLLAITHVESVPGIQGLAAMRELASAMGAVNDALLEKFDAQAVEAALAGAKMNPPLPNLAVENIKERTDDRVLVSFVDQQGKPDTLTLIAIDGKWFADGDEMDEKGLQELGLMTMIAPAMKKASQQIVPRILGDEFTTPEAALQAFQQAMTTGVGGMAPPAGPVPPPPAGTDSREQ